MAGDSQIIAASESPETEDNPMIHGKDGGNFKLRTSVRPQDNGLLADFEMKTTTKFSGFKADKSSGTSVS